MTDTPPEAFFDLTFAPSVELVSTVRRYVTEFYETILGNAELAARVGLATHELLENAVKYGHEFGPATLRVFVSGEGSDRFVNIQTSNRAGNADLSSLQATVDRFGEGDRDAVYQEMMRESLNSAPTASGLGIARVCVEGDMDVKMKVEEGVVTIDARTRVESKEAS